MADYLADHDVPIDYQRRRGLDCTMLLPDKVWAQICRDTCWSARDVAVVRLRAQLWPEPMATKPPTGIIGIATAPRRHRWASRGTSSGPRRCHDDDRAGDYRWRLSRRDMRV